MTGLCSVGILSARLETTSAVRYTDHVDANGTALFQRVCKLDLEGIVAKQKHAPYIASREEPTWYKILNPKYSQREGREELFERDRKKEPVAVWHSSRARRQRRVKRNHLARDAVSSEGPIHDC